MIYICIPAYNEEQTVGVVLWKVRQVMTEFRRDYQILVADDASTDSTPAVLAPYARVLPLTILRNTERRGYAASLEMLLREAVGRSEYERRDVIVTLQADFTDDPQDLVTLVKQIEAGADLVTGNVNLPDGTAWRRRWVRRATEWAAARTRWPDGAGDPLSSFRAYRVGTLQRAFQQQGGRRLLSADGWAANAQLLRAAVPHARRLESVDLTERQERLQRETRFDAWRTFRQVLAVARGRAPAPDETTTIAISDARTDRAAIHLIAGRDAVGTARSRGRSAERADSGGREDRRARDTHGEKSSRTRRENGGEGAGRRSRTATGGRARGGGEKSRGPRADRSADTGAGRSGGERRPPRRQDGTGPDRGEQLASAAPSSSPGEGRPDAEVPDTRLAANADATGDPNTAGEAPTERKRRGRRGGRRRRGGVKDAPAAGGDDAAPPQQPADAAADGGKVSARERADAPGEAAAGSEESGEPRKRRRSRRGSRGGRRRREAGGGDAGEGGEAGEGSAAAEGAAGDARRDAAGDGPRAAAQAYQSDESPAHRQAS